MSFRACVLVIALAGSSGVFGQAKTPSLDETAAWLKEKLTSEAGGQFKTGEIDVDQRYKDFVIDGCAINYVSTWVLTIKGHRSGNTTPYSFSLSDIDPEATQAGFANGSNGVALKTKNGVKKIRSTLGAEAVNSDQARLVILDAEVADRIAKAFRHAANLCGSRAEAF